MPLIVKSPSCRPVTENVQHKYILNIRCLFRKIINAKLGGLLGSNLLFKLYDVIDIFVNRFFFIFVNSKERFFIDGILLSR